MEKKGFATEQGQPTQVVRVIELENKDEYSRYMLHSRAEILDVLRSLIKKNALITVHFDHAASFLLTALLAISPDNERLFFDIGSDSSMNRKALESKKLLLTTSLDKVKVQFSLEGFASMQYEGRPAFSSHLPVTVLRLQRREFFRLSTPISAPVNMLATLATADSGNVSVELPLFDISCGGVGLMVSHEVSAFIQLGDTIREGRITLPEEGLLLVNLLVRNKFDVTTRTGYSFVRMGCEFVGITAGQRTIVQRYIVRVERERKARMSGMG